jgi:hypothetical protein
MKDQTVRYRGWWWAEYESWSKLGERFGDVIEEENARTRQPVELIVSAVGDKEDKSTYRHAVLLESCVLPTTSHSQALPYSCPPLP